MTQPFHTTALYKYALAHPLNRISEFSSHRFFENGLFSQNWHLGLRRNILQGEDAHPDRVDTHKTVAAHIADTLYDSHSQLPRMVEADSQVRLRLNGNPESYRFELRKAWFPIAQQQLKHCWQLAAYLLRNAYELGGKPRLELINGSEFPSSPK